MLALRSKPYIYVCQCFAEHKCGTGRATPLMALVLGRFIRISIQ